MTSPQSITPFSVHLSTQKRELLDRLFSRPRADLATPALEQLFGTRSPDEITAQQVSALLAEYGVRGREAQAVCESIWRKAFVAFVRDDVLEPAEVEYLFMLRRPLNISERFVQQVEVEVAQARYRDRAASVLADATVTPEEREDLERLGRNLRIDPAAQRHIFQQEARKVVEQVAREMAADRRITGEEQERLRGLLEQFGVELEAATAKQVETYFLYWYLESGGALPIADVAIPLDRGEVCHLQVAAEWREQRVSRRGGYSRDVLTQIDNGTLYVTSKRIIFNGARKNTAFKYGNLLGVTPYADALVLERRTGRSPYFFPAAEHAEFAARIALAAFERSRRETTRPESAAAPEPPQQGSGESGAHRLPEVPAPRPAPPGRLPMVYLLAELDKLVGLEPVKRELTSLTHLLRIRKLREEQGLSAPPVSLHMVFTGNPGTGKTTVARLLGSIYQSLGALSKGQLVETDPAGLVGGHGGQTALTTQDVVRSAAGGVLFLDDAYTLASGAAEADRRRKAIDTLLELVEGNGGDLAIVVAGHHDSMTGFLESNPALKARFNRLIEFPDYGPAELLEIFVEMATQAQYRLTRETRAAAERLLRQAHASRDASLGNARLVRAVFERTIAKHSDRVAAIRNPTRGDLCTIAPGDLPVGETFH